MVSLYGAPSGMHAPTHGAFSCSRPFLTVFVRSSGRVMRKGRDFVGPALRSHSAEIRHDTVSLYGAGMPPTKRVPFCTKLPP